MGLVGMALAGMVPVPHHRSRVVAARAIRSSLDCHEGRCRLLVAAQGMRVADR